MTIVLTGCGSDGKNVDSSRPSEFVFQQSVPTFLVEKGEEAYKIYCIGCHGVKGDGQGDAAVFLHPKPRNFQLANFKFSSTRAGQLPTNEDLQQTILQGLKGSAMSSFPLLEDQTVIALITYIKTFSPKWKERAPATAIPFVDDPYRSMKDKSQARSAIKSASRARSVINPTGGFNPASRAIARGEAVYHGLATCWTCHPAYVDRKMINVYLATMENPTRDRFRDDLYESEGKRNSENELIYPPDFRRDLVRAGADIFVLYRSIAAGITGTAMPTWVDSFEIPSEKNPGNMLITRSDLWALAYYVQDLINLRPVKFAQSEVKVRNRARPIYLHGAPTLEITTQPQTEEEAEEFIENE